MVGSLLLLTVSNWVIKDNLSITSWAPVRDACWASRALDTSFYVGGISFRRRGHFSRSRLPKVCIHIYTYIKANSMRYPMRASRSLLLFLGLCILSTYKSTSVRITRQGRAVTIRYHILRPLTVWSHHDKYNQRGYVMCPTM